MLAEDCYHMQWRLSVSTAGWLTGFVSGAPFSAHCAADWGPHTGQIGEQGVGLCTEETGPLPDLSDPATLGCLVALVRKAWPQRQREYTDLRFWTNPGEGEALVAALEAAPDSSEGW